MKNACVAAGHPLTVEAAENVLRDGGNAFDAAIAGFFTACVSESVLASLGGGGFMLARSGSKIRVFDFFVQTPLRTRPEHELDFERITVDFGSAQQDFHMGVGACATPGAVKGMFDIHRQLGSMPMRDLVAPAVQVAREGVQVSALQAYLFSLVEPIYITRSSARDVFGSKKIADRAVQENEWLFFPAMADLLETLAIEGDDLFYRGEAAKLIAMHCADGGSLSTDDLLNYEVGIETPLATDFFDARIYTTPPPSAGGMLISFALEILSKSRSGEFGSVPHVNTLVDALMFAHEARFAATGDESSIPDIDQLLSPQVVDAYREKILKRARAWNGTTHITVVDSERNVASLSVSNGEGCGEVIPELGIMLNNMLGEEDLNPNGFHSWQTNQRMSSMMTPTIVEFSDGRLAAMGSGGSNRIRSAILQVLLNIISFDLDVETALNQPRIHYDDDNLFVEGGFSEATMNSLKQRFPDLRSWQGLNFFFGGVHTIMASRDYAYGAGDPRRGGEARIVRVNNF